MHYVSFWGCNNKCSINFINDEDENEDDHNDGRW